MKRKFISTVLAFVMMLGMLPSAVVNVYAAGPGASDTEHWFYDQLTGQGQDIYDALEDHFDAGDMKTGVYSIDLADGIVEQDAIQSYLDGNRTLFNDFAAAKDAFDLEHPEAWYMDSSYLTLRVTEDGDGRLHAYIGPGRADTYFIQSTELTLALEGAEDTVEEMDAQVTSAINKIVAEARSAGDTAAQVKAAHNLITRTISYRFEDQCTASDAPYIRTTYALITHKGVCEGYARSFQWVMNELGIPCVLIHGVQTSGTPEDHMWTAVYLSGNARSADDSGWYVVDPTWDDPVGLDKNGNIKQTDGSGLDGGETETYLLVGQDVVGVNWRPSGYVSTGTMEFTYPEIALNSYGSSTLERDGLKVVYADDTMEGVKSTVYHVSFNGDGLVEAAKKGYYFLVKMYDVNADGSVDAFDDWYYSVHGLHVVQDDFDPDNDFRDDANEFFADTENYLIYNVSNCDYVEFAITTKAPPEWKDSMDLYYLGGYYSGDYTDILAETGLIFNPNGGYDQAPYVKNASPMLNTPTSVGKNYRIHIEFTDPLYKPTLEDLERAREIDKVNDLEDALRDLEETNGEVIFDYDGVTYAWGVMGNLPHTFSNKPKPTNVSYLWDTSYCKHDGATQCSFDLGCRIYGIEYNFSASMYWADDSIQYNFYLTGLVGTKSNKFPRYWSYIFENESAFCAYRCYTKGGIDWNLWGQPQLLDNPNDLDLSKMVTEGVDGKQESLDQLRSQMHLDNDDMNGRLMLVVENLGSSRAGSEALSDAITEEEGISDSAIKASSLFEIDFARICSKTIVETGQKLRLQIGFPQGFDASMAGITFKAYHFTRDIEGSCDITEEGHVHTGEVTSVEEIPITVTQYGLILICDSFSPYAIVALDSDVVSEDASLSLHNTVTVVTDGYGTVTSDGTAAVKGVDGIVKIPASGDVTFTVEPIDGYELDTISFDGEGEISVEDNTFTISRENLDPDGSDNILVNITFAPKTIHEAEEDRGETVMTATVCTHSKTNFIDASGRVVSNPAQTESGFYGKERTCTETGYIYGKKCEDCGQTLTAYQVLTPALGHSFTKYTTDQEPTCGEPGSETAVCDRDGCNEKGIRPIPPTGEHEFEEGVCVVCGEYETVTNPDDGGSDANDPNKPSDGGDPSDPGSSSGNNGGNSPAGDENSSGNNGSTGDNDVPSDNKPSGGTSRPSGSNSSSNGTTATTETQKDGTTVKTVTEKDGAVTKTTTAKSGTSSVVKTDKSGKVVSMEASVSRGDASASRTGGQAVTLPLQVEPARNTDGAVGIDITIQGGGSAKVEIPTTDVAPGTVAVFVNEDGTEEIVKTSIVTETGVVLNVDGPVTVKIVNNNKAFTDVAGHWGKDAIDFATARELFYGVTENTFSPNGKMTRAMLMVILARFDNEDTIVADGGNWYDKGMKWAVENGVSDGTNPNGDVTREQLVSMLYRYAGGKKVNASLAAYPDAGQVSDWARDAMIWAVDAGIIRGTDTGLLNPLGNATRAELAVIMRQFCEMQMK